MPGPSRIVWDPAGGWLEGPRLEGFDAVVHLAGESVAETPWTAEKKARIHDSRVASTRLLAETLARLDRKPAVFACASAIGFYGDRGDEDLDETSPPGKGFLANVCRQWEAATARAATAGIRVVQMRFGVVFSQRGGAFARTLPMFRRGLGGRLGSGRQYVSWIVLDDVAAAIQRILGDTSLEGPINVVGPNPVTNLELTRTTAGVLHRPALLPIPAFLLRLKLGEMADELVLASQRVYPRRLQAAGHTFAYPELEPAIRRLLGAG
jgi:uncharacterized protein (TIGR01777 family)